MISGDLFWSLEITGDLNRSKVISRNHYNKKKLKNLERIFRMIKQIYKKINLIILPNVLNLFKFKKCLLNMLVILLKSVAKIKK